MIDGLMEETEDKGFPLNNRRHDTIVLTRQHQTHEHQIALGYKDARISGYIGKLIGW